MTAPAHFVRRNVRWLAAGFLLTFASSFGQTFFIAVFAGEIRATFGLGHGDWGALYGAATMASAAVMVFAGVLTDRVRVRWIGVSVLVALAGATVAMSQAQGVLALGLSLFLLRLFGQGMLMQTAMVGMARWFVATRGRAVSIAGLGVAAGEAFLPLLFVTLLGVADWRMLWLLCGAVLLALVPVLFFLLRTERTPQSFIAEGGSTGLGGRMWRRGEVARHWLFWLAMPALLGPAAWNTAFFFHQVHLTEAKGWDHATLVALFPLFTATGVACMLMAGWAVDRWGSARLAGVYLLPIAAGYAVMGLAQTPAVGAVAMVLMGASVGMHSTMSATLWAEFFGTRHLGAIRAMTGAVLVLGTAVGPAATGALIDQGISFPQQAFGIAIYFVVAGVLVGIGAGRAAALMRPG